MNESCAWVEMTNEAMIGFIAAATQRAEWATSVWHRMLKPRLR